MLKTTYQVFNSPAGKTIVFNNLYLINGEFVFNGTANSSDISTYNNIHYRHNSFKQWSPTIRELSEEHDVAILTTPHFYLKQTMYSHPVHTLGDDVFSMFYSLYRCKIDYNPCVCISEMSDDYNALDFSDNRGMFQCLFGHQAITQHHLKRTYSKACFKTFVVGNGNSGLHSYDANYVAPFEDNIWKKFRDAFYQQAGINLEGGNKIIYADSNNWPVQGEVKDALEKNEIDIIHWSDLPDIKDHLNLLKNVKIYITTEGADAVDAIFLPDSAMVIDLGRMYALDNYKVLGYCVDWLWPALSYIDVFYLEDYCLRYHRALELIPTANELMRVVEGLNQNDANLLLKRQEIYNKFTSQAVDKTHRDVKLNNYSPNARLLIANYSNAERESIVENFKRGNTAYACNEQIRPFRKF